MKRLAALLIVGSVTLAGCGSKSPIQPSGGGGGNNNNPNQIVFTAQLAGANEVPPVSGAEANGSGSVTITFNVTRDAGGTITGATVTFAITVTGLPANTSIILGHIHEARAGSNGPVRINTGLSASAPFVLASGTGSLTISNINVDSSFVARVQDIVNDPSGWYFNLHSVANGGGVVRGQLVRQ